MCNKIMSTVDLSLLLKPKWRQFLFIEVTFTHCWELDHDLHLKCRQVLARSVSRSSSWIISEGMPPRKYEIMRFAMCNKTWSGESRFTLQRLMKANLGWKNSLTFNVSDKPRMLSEIKNIVLSEAYLCSFQTQWTRWKANDSGGTELIYFSFYNTTLEHWCDMQQSSRRSTLESKRIGCGAGSEVRQLWQIQCPKLNAENESHDKLRWGNVSKLR